VPSHRVSRCRRCRRAGVTASNRQQTEFKMARSPRPTAKPNFAIHDKVASLCCQRGDQQLLSRAGDFLFDSSGTHGQHGWRFWCSPATATRSKNSIRSKPFQVGRRRTDPPIRNDAENHARSPQNLGDRPNHRAATCSAHSPSLGLAPPGQRKR